MIAFFGTGLLGANFVRAMRERGEDVQVWNRTAEKAKALEDVGATAFEDPADAVRGAERIHLTLSDDAAVDDVLERARDGIGSDTVIIDHTTTSPHGTAERAKRWSERGVRFLHAPVFMGPQNARDATGIMLASGDENLVESVKPELEKMTGKLLYMGPQPERAAAMKLIGNQLIVAMTTGLMDTLALAEAMNISRDDVGSLFDAFNPGLSVPARLKRITDVEPTDPSWTLDMARKDVRLMLEAAERGNAELPVMAAIAERMDRGIEKGDGQKDWLTMRKG